MAAYDDPALPESAATPREVYLSRRRFFGRALGLTAAAGTVGAAAWGLERRYGLDDAAVLPPVPDDVLAALPGARSEHALDRPLTDRTAAAGHTNFYEFSEAQDDVAERARAFVTRPWTVELAGEVHRPQTVDVWSLIRQFGLEQRLYRHRCVEAWAMAVPWSGFSLASLLSRAEPTSHARFVRFESFHAPRQAPNQRGRRYPWPYHEGLRLDEAMHPLTLLAVGVYGEILPAEHGAPIRLVVPWKYGFKSAKSIVRIELTRAQPGTFWNQLAPAEYPFESNVDPMVPHPRWSQATETMLGTDERRATQLMNGYVEQVAHLYRG